MKKKLVLVMVTLLMVMSLAGCTEEDKEDLNELQTEVNDLFNNMQNIVPEGFIGELTDKVGQVNDILENIGPTLEQYEGVMGEVNDILTESGVVTPTPTPTKKPKQ